MSKFLVLTFFFSLNAMAANGYIGGAELLNAKAYSVNFETSVFTTSAHYDDQGVKFPLNPDSSYRLIDTDFKLSYGISSHLEISLLGRARIVKSVKETFSATNSGPESVGVEAKYGFEQMNAWRYALGVRYRQTLFTNTRYTDAQIPPTDEVILGDDGSEYGVDFYGTYNANPWKMDFKLGYNSPPNDLSSEIVYKAEGAYRISNVSLLAGIEGIKSLKRDQYTDTPTLKSRMSTGESLLFNSLNRERVAPYLGAILSFKNVELSLKGQTVVSGRSTDVGSAVIVGLHWNTQGITADSIKIDSFKEYHIDGSVLKVSARGNFIKIDQGLSTDVEKGSKFDIFQTDYFGGNVLVGTGVVFEIGSDWAVIKLTKRYKEIEIKPGFAARGF